MGLPSSSQPLNPGLNFATINAETLDEASREMEFNIPEDKVIDRVCTPDRRMRWTNSTSVGFDV